MTDPWEGYEPRDCGEHRTTGQRAWCLDCQEWCYLDLPCRGCEIGPLRELARAAKDLRSTDALYDSPSVTRLDSALNALRGPL